MQLKKMMYHLINIYFNLKIRYNYNKIFTKKKVVGKNDSIRYK
jgi:hypothetical protein